MRIVIVGYGVQGKKRAKSAKDDLAFIVDPISHDSNFGKLSDVPLDSYDAAILSIPDQSKFKLIKYLLENNKHILVEKPLDFANEHQCREIEHLANARKLYVYSAYNHRFETHIQKLKTILLSEKIGKVYYCKLFYGNGTAQLVRESPWRDQGYGVLKDLGSHLLDLLDFWFGGQMLHEIKSKVYRFENVTPDTANLLFRMGNIQFNLEMSYCSWRNTFNCDILGSEGSLHISGLRKWGSSRLSVRSRVFPSGIPEEIEFIETPGDETWELEYDFFKEQINTRAKTNLNKDLWISTNLNYIFEMAGKNAN